MYNPHLPPYTTINRTGASVIEEGIIGNSALDILGDEATLMEAFAVMGAESSGTPGMESLMESLFSALHAEAGESYEDKNNVE